MGVTQVLQGAASLALLALAAFLGYLAFAVLPRIRSALLQIQTLLEKDVKQLLTDVDGTIKQVNEMMPQVEGTLTHVNGITANVESLTSERLDPIAANVQDITDKIQEDVAKIDQTVTTATEFGKTTIEMATFYRGKLFEPVIEVVSAWSGLKAALTVLKQSKHQNKEETNGEG